MDTQRRITFPGHFLSKLTEIKVIVYFILKGIVLINIPNVFFSLRFVRTGVPMMISVFPVILFTYIENAHKKSANMDMLYLAMPLSFRHN